MVLLGYTNQRAAIIITRDTQVKLYTVQLMPCTEYCPGDDECTNHAVLVQWSQFLSSVLCSVSLSTWESHWLLNSPNSIFMECHLKLVNAEEGRTYNEAHQRIYMADSEVTKLDYPNVILFMHGLYQCQEYNRVWGWGQCMLRQCTCIPIQAGSCKMRKQKAEMVVNRTKLFIMQIVHLYLQN